MIRGGIGAWRNSCKKCEKKHKYCAKGKSKATKQVQHHRPTFLLERLVATSTITTMAEHSLKACHNTINYFI